MITASVSHLVMSDSFATPGTVSCQAPLSMGLPPKEYWGGLPLPTSGDFLDPGIKPTSPVAPADSLSLSHQGSPDLSLIIY